MVNGSVAYQFCIYLEVHNSETQEIRCVFIYFISTITHYYNKRQKYSEILFCGKSKNKLAQQMAQYMAKYQNMRSK